MHSFTRMSSFCSMKLSDMAVEYSDVTIEFKY